MLEIEKLCYQFPGAESEKMQFDLSVSAGEVLSLIGPSGSGKSTLLNLIAGFLEPESGRIRVNGEAIEQLPIAQRPVTIVFQQHNLFPHLDLYTNVALGINPSLKLSTEQDQRIEDALDSLGLSGLEKRKPGELSGGQRQRIALARALVRERKLLLLDEAFAALGPAMREELIELVKALVQRKKMAALLVSHQPRDALIASDRTAFVQNGRIIALQPTRQLLEETDLVEVRSYLGSL
ncbi:MAG: thiamine ABC transporter ATP-binding protein [Gammaproteobacteria bacterium]|nr:thiamine ABC transporter ATP-binding protein [Gammaproteobacteria bacterium]